MAEQLAKNEELLEEANVVLKRLSMHAPVCMCVCMYVCRIYHELSQPKTKLPVDPVQKQKAHDGIASSLANRCGTQFNTEHIK